MATTISRPQSHTIIPASSPLIIMVWPFSSSDPERAESIRRGDAIPNRSERAQCWLARDAYFACLDAHSIDDPLKQPDLADRQLCKPQSQQLDKDCAAAWVKYFKQFRVADLQKKHGKNCKASLPLGRLRQLGNNGNKRPPTN